MKTANMMATTPAGEAVRGFRIGLRGNGRKAMLPCSGYPLYTGERALEVMRQYAVNRPGVEVHAVTCSEYTGYEVLTVAEMELLYGNEVVA